MQNARARLNSPENESVPCESTGPAQTAAKIVAQPMRDFDVAALLSDGGRVIIKVHAKSPAAAMRTALYSIERDWDPADIEQLESLSCRKPVWMRGRRV